jgi:hypothetical protein
MRALALVTLLSFAVRAQEPPPPPPPDSGFSLRVHLLSPDARVQLRQALPGDPIVCTAPCDKLLDLHDAELFTLGGPGLAPSDEFNIRPRDGELTLQVHPASSGPRTAAKVGIVVGALLVLSGGVTGSIVQNDCFEDGGCTSRQVVDNRVTGGLIASGAVVIIVSVIALLNSSRTSYDVVP